MPFVVKVGAGHDHPVVKPLLSLEHPHFGIKFRDRKFTLSLRGGERRHRLLF